MSATSEKRRNPLSHARIIEAAVGYADTYGFSALGVRSLAAELGVQPMSLYHHLQGKDAIVDGVVSYLLDEANLAAPASSWAEWCEHLFLATRDLARRHPGAVEALLTSPTSGTAADKATEIGLDLFQQAGFGRTDAMHAVSTVSLTALGLVASERQLALMRSVAAGKANLAPNERLEWFAQRHPRLLGTASADLDGYDPWAFALRTMLTGIGAQLPTTRRGTRRRN